MSAVYEAVERGTKLEHSGRKGMKWYQHIFGEQDDRAAYNKKGNGESSSGHEGASRAYNKHNISEASDTELRDFIQRKNLEKQYLGIVNPEKPKGMVSRIMTRAGDTLVQKIGDKIGNAVFDAGAKFVTSALGGDNGSKEEPAKKDTPKKEPKAEQSEPKKKKRQKTQSQSNSNWANQMLG